ncbi:cupin domain-containing protein [Caulobacter segnis]
MKTIMICATAWLLAAASGVATARPLRRAPPRPPAPSGFASGAEVQAQLRDMLAAMKPDQGFMWRPLVHDGRTVAAIEIWKKPGRPAVHPAEAEYAIVLEGAGTLVSGGTMTDPRPRTPTWSRAGRSRTGRPALGPGDVILIPAGVPHWFGITGERLVLLGVKLPGAK